MTAKKAVAGKGKKECPKCGEILGVRTKKCPKCGHEFEIKTSSGKSKTPKLAGIDDLVVQLVQTAGGFDKAIAEIQRVENLATLFAKLNTTDDKEE